MVVTIQKQEQHAAIYKFWVETVVETIAENTDEKERKNTP
jgi:hypothetical protein